MAAEDQGIGGYFAHVGFSFWPLLCGRFLHVSAELEAHGRQQFVLEIRRTARGKALEECRGEDRHWDRLVDGGLDRPAPFPESETRPAKPASAASLARAAAVRSSSHEAITLPRRHTSAMSRKLRSYW